MNWFHLQRGLRDLEAAMRSHDDYQIRCVIKELIPEYQWTPARLGQTQPVTQFRHHDGDNRRVEPIRSILQRSIIRDNMNDQCPSEQAANEA